MKNKKDTESDTDRSLLGKLVEGVIVFFICVIGIKLAVETLISIRVPLIIIAVVAAIITVAWRAYKYKRDHDDY